MADTTHKTGSEEISGPVSSSRDLLPTVAMFAGLGAATILAQKGERRPLQALRRGIEMRRAGASEKEIHRATSKMLEGTPYAGVTFGHDKQPRFEIDDSTAKIVRSAIPAGGATFQKDLLQHPEYYKAIPSAQHVMVSKAEGNHSSYDGTMIELGAKHFASKTLGGREIALPTIAGPIAHENMHHVQEAEGFGVGASPRDFRGQYPGDSAAAVAKRNSAYMIVNGEQEAETVRRRWNMTAAQRRADMPVDEVPREHQISNPNPNKGQRSKIDLTSIGDAARGAMDALMNKDLADGKPARFRKLDPSKIKTDAATFQFKSGGDAHGVTDRLKGVTSWDPVAAGKAVVFERANGELVIADGHQRHGLATRLKAEGQSVRMDAYVLRERDGWHPRDVRAYAALKNMKELSGTALDMAKVARDRPDLINGSLPLSDAKIKEAMALAKLSPKAFDMVVGGVVKPEHAASVGAMVGDTTRHADILTEMAKAEIGSAQHARLYVGQVMSAPSVTEQTASLFGEESVVRSLLTERAKVLDRAMQTLKSDKKIFGLLNREADAIESVGNKLSRANNELRANDASTTAALIEKLSQTRGNVSTMLDQAALEMARGKTPSQAARMFVKGVADTLKAGGMTALTGDGPMGWSDKAREASAMARASSKKKTNKMMQVEDVFDKPPRFMVKKTSAEADAKWGKILDDLPVDPKEAKTLARKQAERLGKPARKMMMIDDDGPKPGKWTVKWKTPTNPYEGYAGHVKAPDGTLHRVPGPNPHSTHDTKESFLRSAKRLQKQLAANQQTTMFGEATTKDKIAAASRAKEAKGRVGDPANEGLFSSSSKQVDLADQIKASQEVEKGFANAKAAERQRVADGTKRIGDTYKEPSKPAEPMSRAFTAGLNPMARAKANAALDMNIRNDGKEVLSRAALVEKKIAEGYRVEVVKGERRLVSPEGSWLTEKAISKTGMDYAESMMPKGERTGWSDAARAASAAVRKPKREERAPKLADIKTELREMFERDSNGKQRNTKGELLPVKTVDRLSNTAETVMLRGIPADGSKPFTMAIMDMPGNKKVQASKIWDDTAHLYTQKLSGFQIVSKAGDVLHDSSSSPSEAEMARRKRVADSMPRAVTHETMKSHDAVAKTLEGMKGPELRKLEAKVFTAAERRGGSGKIVSTSLAETRSALLGAHMSGRDVEGAINHLRGTQNEANKSAIIANKKAKAGSKADLVAQLQKIDPSARNLSAMTKVELEHRVANNNYQGQTLIDEMGPKFGIERTKGPKSPVDAAYEAHKTAIQSKVLDPKAKATAVADTREALLEAQHHAKREARYVDRMRADGSTKTAADLKAEFNEKLAATPKRSRGSKALGLLAPIAVGVAALAAANDAKAEGASGSEQVKEATKSGAEAAAVMTGFTLGAGAAVKIAMKAGLTAARAIPLVNVGMMVGGAAYGAATAEPGQRLKGAARGAWDMSLPGAVVNTAVAVRDVAAERAAFSKANATFKNNASAGQMTGMGGTQSGETRKGFANPVVQAAAQAAKGRTFSGEFKN